MSLDKFSQFISASSQGFQQAVNFFSNFQLDNILPNTAKNTQELQKKLAELQKKK